MEKDILNALQGNDPEPEREEDSAEKPVIDGYIPDGEAGEGSFAEDFEIISGSGSEDGTAASPETEASASGEPADAPEEEKKHGFGGFLKKRSDERKEGKAARAEKPSRGKKAKEKKQRREARDTASEEAEDKGLAARQDLYDWIQSLMAALLVCMAIFLFVVHVIDVSGSSMWPTLVDGDKMLVTGLFYKPKQGDIVVFKTDSYDPEKALVKRVIATEGQEVSIDFDRGVVYIDGSPIEEDYIAELTKTKLDFIGPQTVPEGCVFCMGDNRNASTDSRKKEIGMVDTRMILGRTWCVVFPLADARLIK